MAIFIEIIKIEETECLAVYSFGDGGEVFGKVTLDKKSGQIELLEISPDRKRDFYFPRVARKLAEHHKAGKYPGGTSYAA